MKKILVMLMALAMVVSCVAAMAVTTSADVDFVKPVYSSKTAFEADFKSSEVDEESRLINEVLLDGVWTFEYLDIEEGKFYAMEGYCDSLPAGSLNGWGNSYFATIDSMWADLPGTYCEVMSGGLYMHPGNGTGPSITFIAPASGNVSFSASLFAVATSLADANGGDAVYLYHNDKKIWPVNEEDAYFAGDTSSETNPVEVDAFNLTVKKGDALRFVVTCKPGTNRGSKRVQLVQFPEVTYNSTSDGTPIGDPKGYPPEAIDKGTVTDTTAEITWTKVDAATGYNVYVDGAKVNDTPVTENNYTLTGLKAKTFYVIQISCVNAAGLESDLSGEYSFRTEKASATTNPGGGENVTTTPGGEDVTTTPGGNNDATNNDANAEGGSALLWIIIGGAVAVAAIVVVVIILSKKKKAE